MVGRVAIALKREFESQLKRALPNFGRVSGTKGPPLYSWNPQESLSFFLLLVIDPHWERFTVEVAWSSRPEFPWNGDLFSSPFELTDEGKRFRLARLINETGPDVWWELAPRPQLEDIPAAIMPSAETLLTKVPKRVREAVDQICSHAAPYFEKIRLASAGSVPAGFRVADRPARR